MRSDSDKPYERIVLWLDPAYVGAAESGEPVGVAVWSEARTGFWSADAPEARLGTNCGVAQIFEGLLDVTVAGKSLKQLAEQVGNGRQRARA